MASEVVSVLGDGLVLLKVFNFSDCTINKVVQQRFVLKNLSGIRT